MNGAQTLAQTLVNCGVEVCFANPGTSEMHLVGALDANPSLRGVLCLFEGVATGAADGYGRIAGKPAATLLHLGPGLANGLANLHNARRAATPIVNVVGDHAIDHVRHDAPLTADIVGLARPVSAWVRRSRNASSVAGDAARAVQAARAAPGGVATLIVPGDCAWSPAERAAERLPDIAPAIVPAEAVEAIARRLADGKRSAILLRGPALIGEALEAAGRIQAKTGARLLCDTFAPRTQLGAGRVVVERLPYFAEQIVARLAGLEQLVLVSAEAPVSFFAYPGKPSYCAPEGCEIVYLAHADEDGAKASIDLAAALGASGSPVRAALALPALPTGALDVAAVARAMAHLTPEDAIVVDEALTASQTLQAALAQARPHDHLPLAGGAIGDGLPTTVGAAIAAPGRKVVCAQADGSGAYTMQALWTMARERLDATVVVFANRSYAILNIEVDRVGAELGAKGRALLDLHNPELNWTHIATGMGVEASRATTAEQFVQQFQSAMASHGPRLIEAMI
jgi:acetolactate synthase I/II/III large subunit